MPTCGNCHQPSQTIAHVKTCYAQRYTTVKTKPVHVPVVAPFTVVAELEVTLPLFEAEPDEVNVPEIPVVVIPAPVTPAGVKMADFDTIPAAKYVATGADGKLVFLEVQRATKGKWAGKTFVKRLLGAPGDWRRVPMNLWTALPLLAQVAADPKAAAHAYSLNFTTCSRCDAPLSDEVSCARGLGPDCVKHFAGI